jgi:hypothetical protein
LQDNTRYTYFPDASLPAVAKKDIALGDEGDKCRLMTTEEYLALPDVAWPVLQKRTRDYLNNRDMPADGAI